MQQLGGSLDAVFLQVPALPWVGCLGGVGWQRAGPTEQAGRCGGPRSRTAAAQHHSILTRGSPCLSLRLPLAHAVNGQDVFEDDVAVHLVMELCEGGSVLDGLKDGEYSERQVGTGQRRHGTADGTGWACT